MAGSGIRGDRFALFCSKCPASFSDGRVIMLGNIWLSDSSRTSFFQEQILRFCILL